MVNEHDHSPSSGVLSGVFSFISREIGSFVTTATGGTLSVDEEPVLPPSPREKSKKSEHTKRRVSNDHITGRKDLNHNLPHRTSARPSSKRRAKHRTPPPQDYEELSASDDSHASFDNPEKGDASTQIQHEHARYTEQHATARPQKNSKSGRRRVSYHDVEEPFAGESSQSMLPPPSLIRRRQSVSMPGSLFPRSPSLAPEDDRHVRFDSDLDSRVSCYPVSAENTAEPGPSRHSKRITSVKAAVSRFHVGDDEADPSILLPTPTGSPVRDKGKGRAIYSSESQVRGKERELATMKAGQTKNRTGIEAETGDNEESDLKRRRDEQRIRELEQEIAWLKEELSRRPLPSRNLSPLPPPPPPPPPPPLPLFTLPTSNQASTNGDPNNLFASARAALRQAPPPSEAPINPPLSSRRKGQPAIGIAPDKMAAFLKEMKTVRLRKVSGSSFQSENTSVSYEPVTPYTDVIRSHSFELYASSSQETDRSNPPARSKRKRDGDDSFEFRRFHPATSMKRRSLGSFDTSAGSMSTTPPQEPQTKLGYPPSSHNGAPPQTWPSTSSVDAATPSLCSDNDIETRDAEDERAPSTPPVLPFRNVYRFREIGVPVELDPTSTERNRRTKALVTTDVIDADTGSHTQSITAAKNDMLTMNSARRPASPRIENQSNGPFANRLPTSPLPNKKSPVKPRPPGRIRSAPAVRSPRENRNRPKYTNDEDADSLQSSRKRSPHVISQEKPLKAPQFVRTKNSTQQTDDIMFPVSVPSTSGSRPAHGRNSRLTPETRQNLVREVEHQMTLAEELRGSSWGIDDEVDDLENDVLVGVGTNERQGYLAHGGAGGVPVYMPSGYINGAEENQGSESGEEEESISQNSD